MNSLVRFALDNGGTDIPIMYPNRMLKGFYSAGNPTCVVIDGTLYANSRLVNYTKILRSEHANFANENMNQTYYFQSGGFNSRNVVCRYNGDGFEEFKEIDYGYGVDTFYKGFEDCRFIRWNGILYSYGTRWDKVEGYGRICIYELDEEFNVVGEVVANSPFDMECEKNWGAIEDMPFCFIYKTNGTIVVRVGRDGMCDIIKQGEYDDRFDGGIKGSTPVVRYSEKEYISIVHRTTFDDTASDMAKTTYQSAFVFYDNELNITRMSDWFVFRTELCEFSCGLCINDGMVYISYSQIDCTSNILYFDATLIEKFIDGGIWPEYDRDYVYNTAKEFEKNEQYMTSSVLFNYAATLSKDEDDIKKECVIKTFAGLSNMLDTINYSTGLGKLKECLISAKLQYSNSPEIDYFIATICKYQGDSGEAKQYCANGKQNIPSQKLYNYINPNYL